MIVGVDHIALSGGDLGRDGAHLVAAGLAERFTDTGLENLPGKRPLLRNYAASHDIGVFDPPAGLALELTVHGSETAAGSHNGFLPIGRFDNTAPSPDALSDSMRAAIEEAFGAPAELRTMAGVEAPIIAIGGSGTEIVGCVVRVAAFEQSLAFFRDGLKTQLLVSGQSKGGRWAAHCFAGPVPKWQATLLLIEDAAAEPLCLDSTGWPALAVLSSKFDDDLSVAETAGATIYFRDRLVVNDRLLNVAMGRGPSGEIIEILHFPRGVK